MARNTPVGAGCYRRHVADRGDTATLGEQVPDVDDHDLVGLFSTSCGGCDVLIRPQFLEAAKELARCECGRAKSSLVEHRTTLGLAGTTAHGTTQGRGEMSAAEAVTAYNALRSNPTFRPNLENGR